MLPKTTTTTSLQEPLLRELTYDGDAFHPGCNGLWLYPVADQVLRRLLSLAGSNATKNQEPPAWLHASCLSRTCCSGYQLENASRVRKLLGTADEAVRSRRSRLVSRPRPREPKAANLRVSSIRGRRASAPKLGFAEEMRTRGMAQASRYLALCKVDGKEAGACAHLAA